LNKNRPTNITLAALFKIVSLRCVSFLNFIDTSISQKIVIKKPPYTLY
jgi:hypothetical protein